jgi:membrane-bound serine protease (ClpP class)
MRLGVLLLCLLLLTLLQTFANSAEQPSGTGPVLLLEVKDAIGPAVSDFITRGIERAAKDQAQLVIIRMDTPGGLDTAMRDIIQAIVGSPIPIATYVAPSGARAASAGTYILYASHIAAMAPATNLGAATPVQIGGPGGLPGGKDSPLDGEGEAPSEDAEDEQGKDSSKAAKPQPGTAMERKIINDAVAYIRGLAQMRDRNAEWAEAAVREGASLSAADALERGVIDLMAVDVPDLLRQLDGRSVQVMGYERKLATTGAALVVVEPDWRSRLLAVITNPNVAYILMLLGVYGLFFELANPGNILPGVAGAICLLLALYAFQVLPVNYAGVALILLGLAFMVAEVFVPSFGALGIGGAVAFIIGSVILMETDVPGYGVSLPLVVSFSLLSAVFFMTVMTMVVRQRRQPVVTGHEEMVGSIGEATDAFAESGHIRVHGELWQAQSSAPIAKGQRVRVRALEGLTLLIEPLPKEN